jgi:hypothetical protein
MRIGLIAPPWIQVPPPSYSGTEAVVDVLARGLTAAGHEVLLAAAAGSTCPVRLADEAVDWWRQWQMTIRCRAKAARPLSNAGGSDPFARSIQKRVSG